jgi:nucleoside triphosphate pyrophosphatase
VLQLASGSPRRITLLELLGVPFETVPADVDEQSFASPAAAKAEAVARPGMVTVAADTEVLHDGERLGKPADDDAAVTMLARLAGQTHDVRTEVVVASASGRAIRFAVGSRVTFRPLSRHEITGYVATGESEGKAGGYAIQGVGRRLVASFDGCLANVTGLPLCHLYFALRGAGVATRDRPERVCQEHFAFACPVWRTAQRQGRALHDGAEYRSWSDALGGTVGPS